jgi:drug/metabolite transporter (DMT)-like permease
MSKFLTGNLFLLLSMICASSSQVILKALLGEVGEGPQDWSAWRALLTPERLLRGGGSILLVVAGFVFWLLSLARLELSYAYPVACSSILFVALLSVIFLGETVTPRMWLGTVLVLIGIVLLTPQS